MFASSKLKETLQVDEVYFYSAPNWSRPTKALLITGVALAALCFLVGSLPYIISQGALPKAIASLGTICSTPFLIAGSSLLALALLPFIYKSIKHLGFKVQVCKVIEVFRFKNWKQQFEVDASWKEQDHPPITDTYHNLSIDGEETEYYYRFDKRESKRLVVFLANPSFEELS